MTDKLFAIGQVTKVAGQYGEFRVRPLSRYFQAYVEDKPLHLGASELLSREVKLRNKIGVGKHIRYRFEGVDTWDEAESLIGQYIFASVEDSDQINWIAKDLIGCTVKTVSGDLIGKLMEILWLPTNDVYVIRNREEEVLIPVVPEIIKAILLDEKLIIITPMDGLLN